MKRRSESWMGNTFMSHPRPEASSSCAVSYLAYITSKRCFIIKLISESQHNHEARHVLLAKFHLPQTQRLSVLPLFVCGRVFAALFARDFPGVLDHEFGPKRSIFIDKDRAAFLVGTSSGRENVRAAVFSLIKRVVRLFLLCKVLSELLVLNLFGRNLFWLV